MLTQYAIFCRTYRLGGGIWSTDSGHKSIINGLQYYCIKLLTYHELHGAMPDTNGLQPISFLIATQHRMFYQ